MLSCHTYFNPPCSHPALRQDNSKIRRPGVSASEAGGRAGVASAGDSDEGDSGSSSADAAAEDIPKPQRSSGGSGGGGGGAVKRARLPVPGGAG